MFRRQYTFEGKHTKMVRTIKNGILIFVMIIFLHILAMGIIILSANKEIKQAESAFYQRDPDLMAVYTGDSGRIPLTFKLAQDHPTSYLLISGVNEKNSLETLLKYLNIEQPTDSTLLEIDYQAKNTVENVLSTLSYLHKRSSIQTVLIVSHDYHLLRIKMIMNTLNHDRSRATFYYTGIKSDYTNTRNIKLLFKEIYKLIRAAGFLILWEDDLKRITDN